MIEDELRADATYQFDKLKNNSSDRKDSLSSADVPPKSPRRHKRGGFTLRLTGGGVILLLLVNLLVLALLAWPILQARMQLPGLSRLQPTTPAPVPSSSSTPTLAATPTVLPSDTPTPVPSTPISPAPYPLSAVHSDPPPGLIVLSLTEGLDTHLFAYRPQLMPLTRLTDGAWDDITPALSPDGLRVAYASNRSGYWDLYVMNLVDGKITRLTDSLDYDAAPSWSPDGLWIVHETYNQESGGGLDLTIRAIDGGQDPIRLTDSPAADYAPAWSPEGRQVAFISTRSGEPEVWLADLSLPEGERFKNLSRNDRTLEAHPAWVPGALGLTWVSVENGFHRLVRTEGQDLVATEENLIAIGSGDWPVWSPDGKIVLTALREPNQDYLTAYPGEGSGIAWPAMVLPGQIQGITWGSSEWGSRLPEAFVQIAQLVPSPLWGPVLTPDADIPGGRGHLAVLEDIEAPHAMLHDEVDESFIALRSSLAREIGWDFLSSLENAYVPLTSLLDPGMGSDWLYTGRAFASTTMPMTAGWMVILREEFGAETYWRVFLRARYQDGSAGVPLPGQPWDFNARTSGDPGVYEQGGSLEENIPAGYWVDFTRYAAAFGWQRLPALVLWRSSFPAARFNEFVLTGGLDWRSAMLDIYPPEALITPTALVPPTRTPTRTPRWYSTSTPTVTSTPRPTLTPLSLTATPTSTPSPGLASRPSRTPTRTPTEATP